MEKNNKNMDEKVIQELDICQTAPEWAEHARFEDANDPCDDGRTGTVHHVDNQ